MSTPARPTPRRGDIFDTDAGVRILVISSTVYNEIPSEAVLRSRLGDLLCTCSDDELDVVSNALRAAQDL